MTDLFVELIVSFLDIILSWPNLGNFDYGRLFSCFPFSFYFPSYVKWAFIHFNYKEIKLPLGVSTKLFLFLDALCVFGDMMKRTSDHLRLQPKPHLYLAMMRAFAFKGDYFMVKRLHLRIFPDCAGAISASGQAEADELLMEAAINNDQVTV